MVTVIDQEIASRVIKERIAAGKHGNVWRIDSAAMKWLLSHREKLIELSKEFGRPPVLPMILELECSGLEIKALLEQDSLCVGGYKISFTTADYLWAGGVVEYEAGVWDTVVPVWDNQLLLWLADTVLVVLTALNTKGALNQKQMTHSEKLQKARQKAGKPRLADYTLVTINLTNSTETIDRGGTHNSPRAHIVRGHFKKIKEKLHWWGSFMRGDATKGFVTHDYKVTASE